MRIEMRIEHLRRAHVPDRIGEQTAQLRAAADDRHDGPMRATCPAGSVRRIGVDEIQRIGRVAEARKVQRLLG